MPIIKTYSIVATSAINEVNLPWQIVRLPGLKELLKPGLVTIIRSGSYLPVRHCCKLPLWFSTLLSAPPPEPSPSVPPHLCVVPVINELWHGLCELEKTHTHTHMEDSVALGLWTHTATFPNCCRSAPLPLCEQPDPLKGKSDGGRGFLLSYPALACRRRKRVVLHFSEYN